MRFLFRGENFIVACEKAVVIILVVLMVFLSFLQVALRIIFNSGIVWLDPFLRHAVLWVGMTGAALAAYYSSHFALDIINKAVSEKFRKILFFLNNAFTAFAAGVLFYASAGFMASEISARTVAFYIDRTAVPGWLAEMIIPVSLLLITVHSLFHILRGMPETGEKAGKAASR